jgi:2-polyprenyl-3-methyl-5-hydroxy-6-metoxy-1,4-benzoquinol methylase
MGKKSLEYSDELYYNKTKNYFDEKYNMSGLFEWEKPVIERHFKERKNILLIAAGGGREVIALSKMGLNVDGHECNRKLIEKANDLLEKSGLGNRIKYLAKNSVPTDSKEYDGIIIGWGAYSHILGRKERIAFLEKLYSICGAETLIMISFLWTSKRTWKDKLIVNVSNFFRRISFREKTELGDRLVPDYIHYFTEEEVKGELIQVGYRISDYYANEYGCIVAGI